MRIHSGAQLGVCHTCAREPRRPSTRHSMHLPVLRGQGLGVERPNLLRGADDDAVLGVHRRHRLHLHVAQLPVPPVSPRVERAVRPQRHGVRDACAGRHDADAPA